ncbi:hypothetical protein MRB53_040773 [Persea americana]|nr:hypothetical protein MRB53_040773 [Persea americana]
MPKRPRTDELPASDGPPKRARPDEPKPPVEEIYYARQLQDLLVFRQDGVPQLMAGIASLKAFLESVLYHREEDARARQISILREWFETQRPATSGGGGGDGQAQRQDVESEKPFLAQLWQAWSFASQNGHEYLSSAIGAVLALLLKTLSGILDLREFGVLLCRTVLLEPHLRLVKRCLDAPRHKDFLISPCLRLMIEVVGFDGGALAREVYKRRDQTFDVPTLRRGLGMVKLGLTEEEARRRPSIRTLTLRYVLALLKYLHEGGKHLQDDPSDLVVELLAVTEQNVFKDVTLPRSTKAALLTQPNLERVTEIATRAETAASERAFAWLKAVCTQPSYGVLRVAGNASTTQVPDASELYEEGVFNVRNFTLLNWLQTLRPQSDPRERELVLACFTSAPELVTAYFAKKTMQLDPKLSNTWIGYASFLFEVTNLPIPDHLGNGNEWAERPPPTAAMIECILPRPLTQKVLTRCLNQSSSLIAFFAVRILVLALQKLGNVAKLLREHRSSEFQTAWEESVEKSNAPVHRSLS